MSSTIQFNGLYYAGHKKFSVFFSVSNHGIIEFEYDNGNKLDISLQKSALKLIGDPEATLQISWTDSNVNHALLSHDLTLMDRLTTLNLSPSIQTQLLGLQKKQQQQLKSEKKRVPVYMAVICAFFFGSYFLISHSSSFVADMIPYEWEQKIGSFAFENYLLGKQNIDNPNVKSAIKTIIDRIDQFDDSEITYEVAVIDAEMVNAFAFPGGFVVVTSGLINNADNPEQVAGVLSHELTHVIERHGMRKLARQAGLGILIGIVLGDTSALSQLVELSSQLDSLSFDRDQERLADEGAIKIMQAAGLSPQNFVAFFKTLQQLDSVAGDIPEIFRTHPLTDERMERVAAAKEPKQLFSFKLNWERVKQDLQK
jgi:Zn-dependent protease with chaperone function